MIRASLVVIAALQVVAAAAAYPVLTLAIGLASSFLRTATSPEAGARTVLFLAGLPMAFGVLITAGGFAGGGPRGRAPGGRRSGGGGGPRGRRRARGSAAELRLGPRADRRGSDGRRRGAPADVVVQREARHPHAALAAPRRLRPQRRRRQRGDGGDPPCSAQAATGGRRLIHGRVCSS